MPDSGLSHDTPDAPLTPDAPSDGTREEKAPQYVDATTFGQFQQTIQGTLGAITDTLTALRETRPVPTPQGPPPIEDATDEEIEHALQSGTGAKVFRKAVNAAVERVRREQIEPLRQQMVTTGTQLVESVATRDLRHYGRFKKEIDGMVAQLPADTRLTPGLYKWAHDVVVGQHVDEIAREAVEAALRPAPAPEPLPRSGRAGRSTGRTGGDDTPDVYDVAGDEGEAALQERGLDRDGFARRLGYKSWADYMKVTKEYR